MGKILEFGSMFFLGMLLILAMTHFLNGTLISWVQSKFTTAQPQSTGGSKMAPGNLHGGVNVNPGSNAAGASNA